MSKPFDPTKPVACRDGTPARIICSDRKAPGYSIVALYSNETGNEGISYHYDDGRKCDIFRNKVPDEYPWDLVNVPERKSVFVNVYASHLGDQYCTKELADKRYRDMKNPIVNRKGMVELVYEDNELVDVVLHKTSD